MQCGIDGICVEIWYYLVPLSSAQFWLQRFSPTMMFMVRSCSCFAFNRHFGNTCPARWGKWENFITIGLVMPTFGSFAHHYEANEKISSSLVWRYQSFRTFTRSSKLEKICTEVWIVNFISRRKFDDLRDHRWHLFENFAMKVVEFQFCDVLSRLLEEQGIRTWKFQPFEDARCV